MTCKSVRAGLLAASGSPPVGDLTEHLERCRRCRRYRERLDVSRELLAGIECEPDAGFAARVAARIDESVGIGWASARLLPATVAIAAVLAVLCLHSSPDDPTLDRRSSESSLPERTVVVPTSYENEMLDDLLLWAADDSGSGS